MHVIGCEDLVKLGLWSLAKCCRGCHEGTCPDELAMPIGVPGATGAAQLNLCCKADDVELRGEDFARLLATAEGPASARPAPAR